MSLVGRSRKLTSGPIISFQNLLFTNKETDGGQTVLLSEMREINEEEEGNRCQKAHFAKEYIGSFLSTAQWGVWISFQNQFFI